MDMHIIKPLFAFLGHYGCSNDCNYCVGYFVKCYGYNGFFYYFPIIYELLRHGWVNFFGTGLSFESTLILV